MKNIIHDWDDEKSLEILSNLTKIIENDAATNAALPIHQRVTSIHFLVIEHHRLTEESAPNVSPADRAFTNSIVLGMGIHMLVVAQGQQRSAEKFNSMF